MSKSRRILIIGLLAVTIASILALATWFTISPKSSFNKESSLNTAAVKSIETCDGQGFTCYDDYLLPRTINDGPAAAMADLRRVYNTDTYVQSQCHQLTHIVGRAALQKYKTIKETFPHGDSLCWSGYYHGAVEAAIQQIGADDIRNQANQLCSGFTGKQQYSFDHYNCVHGMGHGFMAVDELRVFDALNTCDLLTDSWERESCYGGVYMENVMIEARGDGRKSAYLRSDEPMYPCTAVDHKYKQACYLSQTSYALQQNQYNFHDTFMQCSKIPDKDFIDTCYQSIGRDASGSTVSDIAKTTANCQQALDERGLRNCSLGAVRDFISFHYDDKQAKLLCEEFSANVRTACQQEAVTYYATMQ